MADTGQASGTRFAIEEILATLSSSSALRAVERYVANAGSSRGASAAF